MSGDMNTNNNQPDMSNNNNHDMPAVVCGNGTVEAGETCDGANCPTSCPAVQCVTSVLVGAAATCDARCDTQPITACQSGDGCCPVGCTLDQDTDCMPADTCGNGKLDAGEACDGADCPTIADCRDDDACTADSVVGNAAMCDATCLNDPIVLCIDGDGCCRPNCMGTDSDCNPNVGPSPGETGSACADDAECGAAGAGFCVVEFPSGYCTTLFCQDDMDCAGDGQCVPIDDRGTTACLDACAATADCRQGYECESFGPGLDFCLPPQDQPSIGSACAQDADCGAGQDDFCIADPDFPGGYCTILFCQDDTDCGGDSLCLTVDEQGTTACFDGCVSDADCRQGYLCENLGQPGFDVCLPPQAQVVSNTAQPCFDDSECTTEGAGQAFCLTEDAAGWPGGYCSATCSSDTDCGVDGICQDGACVLSCASNADCRAGYTCQNFFASGPQVCAPATGGKPGATCAADSDCVAGIGGAQCALDLPGGYCVSGCQTDAGCPAGSVCEQGVCLDSCTVNADCRAGYECYNAFGSTRPICGPVANGAGAVGDACATISDCAGGQRGTCLNDDQWTGGYCLISGCDAQNPCPAGSHCGFIDPATGQGACVKDCTTDAQCRGAGYACYNGDMAGPNECMPAATGTGAVGAACDTIVDCAGGQYGFCLTEAAQPDFVGGYCSIDCTTTGMCPAGAACVTVDPQTGSRICLDTCTSDAQCRNSYSCLPFGGSNVCLPF
jgi:hypothetical protein